MNWAKKKRRNIRRDELLAYLAGKPPPPRNSHRYKLFDFLYSHVMIWLFTYFFFVLEILPDLVWSLDLQLHKDQQLVWLCLRHHHRVVNQSQNYTRFEKLSLVNNFYNFFFYSFFSKINNNYITNNYLFRFSNVTTYWPTSRAISFHQ